MSLQSLQELSTALYLSSAEREAWKRNADVTANKYSLDNSDKELLKNLNPERLRFYADSLKSKRFNEIAQFIPETMKKFRAELWQHFQEYAESYVPIGCKKVVADSLSFGEFLKVANTHVSNSLTELIKQELAPWRMNFLLEKQSNLYKASKTTFYTIQANRYLGGKTKIIFLNSESRPFVFSAYIHPAIFFLKLPFSSVIYTWRFIAISF
ncbi:MAG: hypothetical protein EXS63_09020 [Candidatus Omnitrophica bacterium]|nr:hypothetical protein [Candidatus Omnitrophota bacterium]